MAVNWPGVQVNYGDRIAGLADAFLGGQKERRAQDLENNRRQVLQGLQRGPDGQIDFAQAAERLLSIGDQEGGMRAAQLAEQQGQNRFRQQTSERDFTFRQQEAQRAQQNADRSFGLQRQQFDSLNALRNRPDIKFMKGPMGEDIPVQVGPDGSVTPVQLPGGMGQQPTNPYAPRGKMTEGQSNAALYGTRMAEAHQILNSLEGMNADVGGGAFGIMESMTPGFARPALNTVSTADRQRLNQAKRNFINATLRRESGAAISPSEFSEGDQQYFPQPGDSAEVIAQKRRNRETAIKGIMGAAGPAYQPPESFQPAQPAQQQAPQIQEGATATNPQTGQKIRFQNGQWVPVQ